MKIWRLIHQTCTLLGYFSFSSLKYRLLENAYSLFVWIISLFIDPHFPLRFQSTSAAPRSFHFSAFFSTFLEIDLPTSFFASSFPSSSTNTVLITQWIMRGRELSIWKLPIRVPEPRTILIEFAENYRPRQSRQFEVRLSIPPINTEVRKTYYIFWKIQASSPKCSRSEKEI